MLGYAQQQSPRVSYVLELLAVTEVKLNLHSLLSIQERGQKKLITLNTDAPGVEQDTGMVITQR